MILTIVILSVVTLILGYTTYNLLRKIEAFEDVILEQEQIIGDTASRVDTAMPRMKDIDRIGSFEADDETGEVFKQMYEIISNLEKYYGETEIEETK